ncbi:pseudouridine synthase [Cyclobacterium jeungdonense]|uniref:Pseudouridine synthase n=1 Tax=Cyclobacterium jeungdonense TaxID=708087 RepID=A0ABT8C6M7_9BACT|nr:pseudouridine synthase [Cyclobacterium jeungdonense]MDN3687717.1 pseudouridine synthase [Cyclobacterium jeungdonense]
MDYRYFVVYKPFGMLSQFSGEAETLAELGDFPSDVYPVGRLDKDSEGLLLLTNDNRLNHLLLDPLHAHERTYWVQVEGDISDEALQQLKRGLTIKINGKPYKTSGASANLHPEAESELPERVPPIRYRKNVPDSWIALSLKEGKNRQVRKMTAAVGFPTLRLVRWSIESLTIQGFQPGEVRSLEQEALYEFLRIPLLINGSSQGKKPKFHPERNKRRF